MQSRDRVRAFVQERVKPHVDSWYDQAVFPRVIATAMGGLCLLGMHLSGYGCPGRSAVEYGLACWELEAGDSGIRAFAGIQGSLAMGAIRAFGSEEQKRRWLPPMARGEVIGCFGLTESATGGDPAGVETLARKEGSDWVLDGTRRRIALASLADVAVIRARTNEGVRGFLVPTDSPGYTAGGIRSKSSMHAAIECDITLHGVRLPASARLPGAQDLSAPLPCLDDARYGVAWGALGAARESYEAASDYSKRLERPTSPYTPSTSPRPSWWTWRCRSTRRPSSLCTSGV